MRQMHGYAVLLRVVDCTTLTNCGFGGSPNVQDPQPTTSLLVDDLMLLMVFSKLEEVFFVFFRMMS